MFRVKFGCELVASVNTLEEAVSLALALHRSSNEAHIVCVADDSARTLITFDLAPASGKSVKPSK